MATTRRELLRRGAATGAAAAAAGAGAGAGAGTALAVLAPGAQAAASTPAGGSALTHALKIEQLLVVAYGQAIGSGVLDSVVKDQLSNHLSQETEHVAIIGGALAELGLPVPPAPSLAAAQTELTQHQISWRLTRLRSQHDCLKLLIDVESLAESAYFQAVATLEDLSLAGTCTQIMGSEAQHWTVLSGFLNHRDPVKAVPYPFVAGAS